MCPAGPSPAAAQDVDPNQSTFRIGDEARAALQQLWEASVAAQQERVACIGGYRRDSIVYITKVEALAVRADFRSSPARESLARCGPPEWVGTVHTHIATFDGRRYVTFSSNDHRVMAQWRIMWHTDGVFCVLYSEQHAHCEAWPHAAGEVLYAQARGNRILR